MDNENTVMNTTQESVPVDAELAPEQPTAEDNSEPISTIVSESNEDGQEQAPAKEPGWIKGRINKAVEKAVADAEKRVAAQYEEMLAPIREQMLEREAQELVDNGEVKSLEIAKELINLRKGNPAPQKATQKAEPQRDEKGQFTSAKQGGTDPVIQAKGELLAAQAQKIKSTKGLDVMSVFQNNKEIQQKVINGEWDFYDVAEQMQSPRHVPSPTRTPNGGGVGRTEVMTMSSEQFKKLQENLSNGKRYDMRV